MEVKKGQKEIEGYIIPKDWQLVPLGDFLKFKNGLNKEKHYFGTGTPIVNYMDVYKNRGITENDILGTVTLSFQEIKNYEVKKGDILFTRTSETVEDIGVSSVILTVAPNTVFSGFVLRARPKDDRLESNFAKYCFSTKNVRKEIISQSTYTTRALTNGRHLSKVKIALPSTLKEQSAIATVLSEIDSLITNLEKLIAKKEAVKKGTIQALLTGKKRLPGFNGKWQKKKIKSLFKFLSTANNSRSELSDEGEIGYIHYGDIHTRWNEFLDVSTESIPFIKKYKIKDVPFLENGDLLIADASEDYEGLCACIELKNVNHREIVGGLHTLLLRGNKNEIADGFKGYLRHLKGFKEAVIRVANGISVYGISKKNLGEIEIIIPDINEQSSIAAVITDMTTEIKLLEEKLQKYKAIRQGMMQNLLTGKIRLV